MAPSVPPAVIRKVAKLAQLPGEAKRSRWAVPVTRLTTLKSLCQDAAVAARFVTYLAAKTLERLGRGQSRSRRRDTPNDRAHRQLMAEALAEMEAWQRGPTAERRERLLDLLMRARAEQNEHRRISWGSVRVIEDMDLLVFERALRCLLNPTQAGHWAYQMARDYAERYDPRYAHGLTPASAPLLQDIADFWIKEFGLDPEALAAPDRAKKPAAKKERAARSGKGPARGRKKAKFTPRQGQYLAFIHHYRQLHRQGPAELDIVQYFRVTPPSAHGMVVRLEELGLVTREPGVPRSVRVAIPEDEIPPLEPVGGRPW